MVGYPGETEAQFKELEDFIREVKFDRLGIFTYSHEEGTHAYKLIDDLPEKVKTDRMQHLMDIQAGISLEKNKEKLNKVFKVIIDREEADHFIGRTEFDSPEVDNEVIIKKTIQSLKPGSFQLVKIFGADTYDLHGSLLN
jgi:ribosomal protein S12 methylthiotransferase